MKSVKFPAVHKCAICDTHFPDFSVIYFHVAKPRAVVGQCCIDTFDNSLPLMGTLYRRATLTEDHPTPWEYIDFTFFLTHPNRSHQLRRAFEMEYPELNVTADHKVVVRHVHGTHYIKVLLNPTFSKHIIEDEEYLTLVVQVALEFKNDQELVGEDVRDYVISV